MSCKIKNGVDAADGRKFCPITIIITLKKNFEKSIQNDPQSHPRWQYLNPNKSKSILNSVLQVLLLWKSSRNMTNKISKKLQFMYNHDLGISLCLVAYEDLL